MDAREVQLEVNAKNARTIIERVDELAAQIAQLQEEMRNRDKVFANQTSLLQDLQRQLGSVMVINAGNGATTA